MKTFLVPFQEQETVWVEYQAKVEANSQDEAFLKVKQLVNNCDSPHQEYDCENIGITEHIESDCKFFMDDYTSDDVKVKDDRLSCEISHTAFDIARLGKDALYNEVENIFLQIGLRLEIFEMDMIPVKIEEHFVTYRCVPTEYKIIFRDNNYIHWKDGVKMNQDIKLEDLEITPLLMSKSCNYDSTTNIKLSETFPISQLDKTLCDNKSDVVKYRGKTYICGILDGGYALWECEV